MPIPENLPFNTILSHPFFQLPPDKQAKSIHRHLLELSKQDFSSDMKKVIRKTADYFRESAFGKTAKQIRAKIIEVLREYFDGETFNSIELDDLVEETGISAKELTPVLEKMIDAGEIVKGRRRRWNEPGKHFNDIYKLSK